MPDRHAGCPDTQGEDLGTDDPWKSSVTEAERHCPDEDENDGSVLPRRNCGASHRRVGFDQGSNDPHADRHDSSTCHYHGDAPESIGEQYHGDQSCDKADNAVNSGRKELRNQQDRLAGQTSFDTYL
jgi:hypothetical protein